MRLEIKEKDMPFILSELALKAILYEVASYPTPGLVSPISSGIHKDMDYFTFIDSAVALNRFFIETVEIAMKEEDYKELFQKIRMVGMDAEKHMLKATCGVNTHKGLIFIMIIALGATTLSLRKEKDFSSIRSGIKAMTEGIVHRELVNLDCNKKLSYGEKIYIKYGIPGIRKEVESGLPIIFDYSLPLYSGNKSLSKNDNIIHTLIGIMSRCDDTTLLHRKTIDTLEYVKNKAKEAMDLGGMNTELGKKAILEMDEEFMKLDISPGGSADLVAMTLFFYEVKKLF